MEKLIIMGGKTNYKMPAIFIGHGSPLNALSKNDFTKSLERLAQSIPRPRAILAISAHWLTTDTKITSHASPKTIHDFFGFPEELYQLYYPAPGFPSLALKIAETLALNNILVRPTQDWGLDHGAWMPLTHMYPEANIPILQLSINKDQPLDFHFKLGQSLRFLREQEVLIVGSGNVVHNLEMMNWTEPSSHHSWATDFENWVVEHLDKRHFAPLIFEMKKHPASSMCVPTLDHYLPLLYVLGASTEKDIFQLNYRKIEHSAISMLTFTLNEEGR